jgi:branched-chain amino acid aminotransferase
VGRASENEASEKRMKITNQTHSSAPEQPLDPRQLEFGRMFTPNFFVMDYRNGEWCDARIQPVAPFALHPASLVFHYAQTVFEGLKAFRQQDGRIVLFRPELNAARFRESARRLCIPAVDEPVFVEAISALVENERHFLPGEPGCFYIRPTVMGIDATLGVRSASEFVFFILTLPSGGYFKGTGGAAPGAIDVLVSTSVVRSAPGMMGSVKAGANYAGTLNITEHAKTLGCSQVLFLDAHQHRYIDEMGGMNIMFVQGNVLRTPPLTDTILRGVTRDSLLVIARDQGLEVSEAPITIDEVVAGMKDGSIPEMFACGTAAVVIGIKSLRFEDGSTVNAAATPGPVTTRLYAALTAVQYGRAQDPHNWVREICRSDAPAPAAAAR